jgi:hypothetical protein
MTNIGTGTTATTGAFNLQVTAGTATLKLDSANLGDPTSAGPIQFNGGALVKRRLADGRESHERATCMQRKSA